jgi:hypothetical protein
MTLLTGTCCFGGFIILFVPNQVDHGGKERHVPGHIPSSPSIEER